MTHSLKHRDLPERARRMSRLCTPELFLARRAVRVGVSLGGSKVLVGVDVSKSKLVSTVVGVLVLHHPLLRFRLRCSLCLDFFAGVVDFGDMTTVDCDEIYGVGRTHDCG